MSKHMLILLLLIIISFSSAQDLPNIAVLDLDAAGVSLQESKIISERLRTDLFNTGKFTVLEREKMEDILKEQSFQMTGCTSTECAIEVGRLIGVKQIVAGSIGRIGTIITLNIRLIDAEAGNVIKTATEDCDCSIETVLTQSVSSVAQILSGAAVTKTNYNIAVDNQKSSKLLSNEKEWEKLDMSFKEWQNYQNSNLTLSDWYTYQKQRKAPGLTVLKSAILPGWGQISCQQKRGFLYTPLILTALYMYNSDLTKTYEGQFFVTKIMNQDPSDSEPPFPAYYNTTKEFDSEKEALDWMTDLENQVIDWNDNNIGYYFSRSTPSTYYIDEIEQKKKGYLLFGTAAFVVNLVDAYLSANAVNKNVDKNYNLGVIPDFRRNNFKISLTYNF